MQRMRYSVFRCGIKAEVSFQLRTSAKCYKQSSRISKIGVLQEQISACRNALWARSDFVGSTKIRAEAANIQSSVSLSGTGQSIGVLIAVNP
jgi:hypothetical protein